MNQGMRDEIKKLVEESEAIESKATKGPWKLWGMSVLADVKGTSDVKDAVPVADTHYQDENGRPRTFNATFIAHAREAMPVLCAEVRRLDAELKRFQIIAGTMTGYLQSLGFEVVTEQDGTVSIAPATPDAIAR